MGIRDFLDDVVYYTVCITSAFGELGVGLTKTLIEGTAEFGEIMTDGVKEMLIEGNSDYKTSFEKKDMASERIYNARSRWEVAEEKFNEKLEETNYAISNNYEYKKMLMFKLSEKMNDNYITDNLVKGIYFSKPYNISFYRKFEFSLASQIGILGKKIRKNISDEYLEDAISYGIEVDMEISKIDILITLLESINKQILEENRLLSIFEDVLIKNRKINFEESYELIKEMIITEISDENGNISNRYLKEFRKLRHICSQFLEDLN